MNVRDAITELARMRRRLRRELTRAEGDTIKDARDIARELSSGPYSLAQLARMGHPYARRHAQPSLDPAVINAQTGEFRRAWTIQPTQAQGESLITALVNNDRVAGYLRDGTKYMVPRPIEDAIRRSIEPIRQERLQRAIERALKGS